MKFEYIVFSSQRDHRKSVYICIIFKISKYLVRILSVCGCLESVFEGGGGGSGLSWIITTHWNIKMCQYCLTPYIFINFYRLCENMCSK